MFSMWKEVLCLFGQHDWRTYHRWFCNSRPSRWGENSNKALFPGRTLRPVHKCKRCGKKIYVY